MLVTCTHHSIYTVPVYTECTVPYAISTNDPLFVSQPFVSSLAMATTMNSSVHRGYSAGVDWLSCSLVGLSLAHAASVAHLVTPKWRIASFALAVALLLASCALMLRSTDAGERWARPSGSRCEVASQCIESELAPRPSTTNPSVDALRRMLLDHGQVPLADDELLRHLEAAGKQRFSSSLNVAAGYRRVISTAAWRASRAVDRERRRTGADATGANATERRVELRGTDLLGRPCLRIRLREPLESFPEELLAVLEDHFFDTGSSGAPSASAASGQVCVVLDLSGVRASSLYRPPLAAGFELLRQLRAHFPQRAASVHVVRLPPFARWVVGAACSLLDSRTARKVVVHDGVEADGRIPSLGAHFAPSQLPIEWGGTEPDGRTSDGACTPHDGRGEAEVPARPSDLRAPSSPSSPPPHSPAPLRSEGSSLGGAGAPRLVWSVMSASEAAAVSELRAALLADAERSSAPPSVYTDDELLRYLADCVPKHDVRASVEAIRVSWRTRRSLTGALALPIADAAVGAMGEHVRVSGRARTGEAAVLVVISRSLQDVLLDDPEPFLAALLGRMEAVKTSLFVPGRVESVVTIVQVERGFKLSLSAVPVAATQRMMRLISDLYPSYTSRILIVNLPVSHRTAHAHSRRRARSRRHTHSRR